MVASSQPSDMRLLQWVSGWLTNGNLLQLLRIQNDNLLLWPAVLLFLLCLRNLILLWSFLGTILLQLVLKCLERLASRVLFTTYTCHFRFRCCLWSTRFQRWSTHTIDIVRSSKFSRILRKYLVFDLIFKSSFFCDFARLREYLFTDYALLRFSWSNMLFIWIDHGFAAFCMLWIYFANRCLYIISDKVIRLLTK